MHEPIDVPAHLTFRSRNHARAGRQGSQAVWIVVALVGAVLFVLLIRTLLERTSATIRGSVTSVPVEAGDVGASSAEGSYDVPAVPTPTPDEEGFYPSTGMVYRCVGKGGAISFQSEPCGPDARMTKAVHAPPERELPRRMTHASNASANASGSNAQYARVSQSSVM